MWPQLRRPENHEGIDVGDLVASSSDQAGKVLNEVKAPRILSLGVILGKVRVPRSPSAMAPASASTRA